LNHQFFCREIKRLIKENKISEDDYKIFQEELLKDPKAGSVIPGFGGLRKIRLGYHGKGTRSGLRIDYLDIPEAECLHLLVIYPKSVKKDLTPDQKREIRELVNILKKEAISRVQKIKR
jgi:hypothetical protein